MSMKDILSQLENAPEVKAEAKRIIDEFKKGPTSFDMGEIAILMLSIRMGGVTQEQLLIMASNMMNRLMRVNGISEDEMMEYIRKYK